MEYEEKYEEKREIFAQNIKIYKNDYKGPPFRTASAVFDEETIEGLRKLQPGVKYQIDAWMNKKKDGTPVIRVGIFSKPPQNPQNQWTPEKQQNNQQQQNYQQQNNQQQNQQQQNNQNDGMLPSDWDQR